MYSLNNYIKPSFLTKTVLLHLIRAQRHRIFYAILNGRQIVVDNLVRPILRKLKMGTKKIGLRNYLCSNAGLGIKKLKFIEILSIEACNNVSDNRL